MGKFNYPIKGNSRKMNLAEIRIFPAEPAAHFVAIAALMSSVETEPTTAASLAEWYAKQVPYGGRLAVAVSPDGQVCGFNGIYRTNTNIERYYGIYLIIPLELRGQGIGSLLYADLLSQAVALNARTLRARVRDDCQPGIHFAEKHDFKLKYHSIEMKLDLLTWDDQQYDSILATLHEQGFIFTNMAEQGDTQEARRKLYVLNNTAAATDPGSDGIPPWSTFEEFEQDVCSSAWYHPDAQFIAIDSHSGEWAAMSAITVFDGADHAYNLFTGTDVRYRNRKLAQAVKTLALRRARQFGVNTVRTSHTSKNSVMIGIDLKLGYMYTPGTLVMEKELDNG
jgi:RimJ/RimL family protein N-acetyltransferase